MSEEIVERIEEVCGIYFRSVLLERNGTRIPQHVHDHDHATLVCSGAARVWVDGELIGDFDAGRAVPVLAGKMHEFQALLPMTRLACVHDVASAESIKEKGL